MQLTPADRRTIIEDLLDIQIFSVMNLLVKQRFQENKESVEKNRMILKSAQDKKDYVEKTLNTLRQNNDDKLTKLEKQLADFTQQKEDLLAKVKILLNEKDALVSDADNLTDVRNEYANSIISLTNQESKVQRYGKEIEFLTEHDECPTCKQHIDVYFRERRKNELHNDVSETQKYIDLMKRSIDDLLMKINNLENKSKRTHSISAEIKSSKQTMMHIVSMMNDIEDNMSKIRNSDKLVIDSETDLKSAIEEIRRMEGSVQHRLNERTMIETAIALLKDGGVKTKIIKQYVPIINKHVNKYLDKMGFFVKFNIDENFNEVIKSRYRDEFAYSSFSEGEKTRIDLALMFTWRAIAKMKNSINTNLLILDEILDGSLDANGTDEFLNIIKTLTDDTNIYIISHKQDQLLDKFDKVYRFEKHKNFSRLA
jgi:ABC-type molybdenum transport system ATPase subunit/photorepair protein PhrA